MKATTPLACSSLVLSLSPTALAIVVAKQDEEKKVAIGSDDHLVNDDEALLGNIEMTDHVTRTYKLTSYHTGKPEVQDAAIDQKEATDGSFQDPFERFDPKKTATQRGSYYVGATWQEPPNGQAGSRMLDPVVLETTSTSNSKSKQPKSSSSKGPKSCKDSKTKNPSDPTSSSNKKTKSPSSKSPKSSDVCEDEDVGDDDVLPPVEICPKPDVPANPRCFTGDSTKVTQDCSVNNASCCVDGPASLPACSLFTNATVCENSCNGDSACIAFGTDTYIAPGSCNGESACNGLGQYAVSFVEIKAGSCNGVRTCTSLGSSASQVVEIKAGSCNGVRTCTSLGSSANQVIVNENACSAYEACNFLGFYVPGTVNISSCACPKDRSCPSFGAYFSPPPNIYIGSYACNETNACSGITTGGSSACYEATGMYGSSLPPFATGC